MIKRNKANNKISYFDYCKIIILFANDLFPNDISSVEVLPTLLPTRKYSTVSDIDNNGYLDAHDFQCLALRTCVLEGKGDCSSSRLQKYQHIMLSLWEEIAQLADFDKVPDYVGYTQHYIHRLTRCCRLCLGCGVSRSIKFNK